MVDPYRKASFSRHSPHSSGAVCFVRRQICLQMRVRSKWLLGSRCHFGASLACPALYASLQMKYVYLSVPYCMPQQTPTGRKSESACHAMPSTRLTCACRKMHQMRRWSLQREQLAWTMSQRLSVLLCAASLISCSGTFYCLIPRPSRHPWLKLRSARRVQSRMGPRPSCRSSLPMN